MKLKMKLKLNVKIKPKNILRRHNPLDYLERLLSKRYLLNKRYLINKERWLSSLRLILLSAFIALILPGNSYAADLGEEVTFGSWYLRGELRANLLIDTVHNDAGFSVARTEVFGDDGSKNPQQNSDNSRIPIDLDLANGGIVASSRALVTDVPELGFSLLGSRITLGTEGEDYKVLFELGVTNPNDPYALELHRLWLEYGRVGIGLGWSTFMDFKKDERATRSAGSSYFPDTVDYIGPPGFAYERQLALRVRMSPKWYLGLEEPRDLVYRGHERADTNNDDFAAAAENLVVRTSSNNSTNHYVYEVTRRLRTRHLLPNLIFTYYGSGDKSNIFASFLLQQIKLDNNSPLLLESDSGYQSLIDDSLRIGEEKILEELDRQLGINDDLKGGLQSFNLAMNLGINGPMGLNNNYNLAYIYNGGRYLRDNPNPSHLIVKKDIRCQNNCKYELVNIVSHSYLMDFRFNKRAGKRVGLIFSGTVTDNDYGIALGGAATKQVHTTYVTYHKPFAKVVGLSSNYEVGYSYRQSFNTRNNSKYPRLRFSYGLGYKF